MKTFPYWWAVPLIGWAGALALEDVPVAALAVLAVAGTGILLQIVERERERYGEPTL